MRSSLVGPLVQPLTDDLAHLHHDAVAVAPERSRAREVTVPVGRCAHHPPAQFHIQPSSLVQRVGGELSDDGFPSSDGGGVLAPASKAASVSVVPDWSE